MPKVERALKLLATLSYRHGSLDRYLDEIARAVSDLLEVDWVVVTLKLEQDQEIVLASTLDSFDREAIYPYHGSVSLTVFQSGQSLVVEDTYATPQYGQAPAGYRAYLGVSLRNATEITSPSGLPYRPSSVLRQQLHSPAMRLLSRLEYERSFGASLGIYFLRILKECDKRDHWNYLYLSLACCQFSPL